MSIFNSIFGRKKPVTPRPGELATTPETDEKLFRSAFDDFMCSKQGDQLQLAEKLLSFRSLPIRSDWGNVSALHYAENVSVAQLLINHGMNVYIQNSKGETPLHYAAKMWNCAIVEFLISKGAEVNAKDNNGNTSLHKVVGDNCGSRPGGSSIAMPGDFERTIDILLAHGADASILSSSGLKASDEALIELRKRDEGRYHNVSFQSVKAYADAAAKLGADSATIEKAWAKTLAKFTVSETIMNQQIVKFEKTVAENVEAALRLLFEKALLAIPILTEEIIRNLYEKGGFEKSWGSTGLQSGSQEYIRELVRKNLERFRSETGFVSFDVNVNPEEGYAKISAIFHSESGYVFRPLALWRSGKDLFICATAHFEK